MKKHPTPFLATIYNLHSRSRDGPLFPYAPSPPTLLPQPPTGPKSLWPVQNYSFPPALLVDRTKIPSL